MFYVFPYKTVGAIVEADAVDVPMLMTPGIIHQVDILFQDECNHELFLQIWDDLFQVWPSNRGEWFRGNATVTSFREFYELIPGSPSLTAKVYTTLTDTDIEVIIQIGLLPKKIIQPLSFEELLAAAAGLG